MVWPLLGRVVSSNALEQGQTNFDPSVRLTWDVGLETRTYLSWSTGYKSGGITGSTDTINLDGTPGDGTYFDPEEASAWELGVKTSFWDGRARLSAAAFYTEIEDLQVTSFEGLSFRISNAAKSTVQGLEIESQFALTDTVEVGANLAFLDSEYDEYGDAPCTIYQLAASTGGCTQDLAGETTPFAPETSGNFYVGYETGIGRKLVLRARADANYKDDFFTDGDLDPNSLQEGFWKFDARITLASADDTWELAAYGRNLTDERTLQFTVDAPLSAGIYASGVDESRVFGLQAVYRF